MKIKCNTLSSVLLLVFALIPFAGLAAAEKKVKTASATAKGAPPAVLFQKYCQSCHRENGNGKTRLVRSMNPRPRDFTLPEAAKEFSRERMITSVTQGRPGNSMVGQNSKLTTGEIASIVDYIRATFMRAPETSKPTATISSSSSSATTSSATTSAAVPAVAQTEQNKWGQQLFKKNCASCHGDKGNTAVWARSGLNPAPRDFTSAQAKSELTRERMIHSVTNGRPGTAMMAFATRLSNDDVEAVVSYIRSSFMQVVDEEVMSKTKVASVDTKPSTGPHDQAQKQSEQPPAAAGQAPVPAEHAEIDMALPMPNGVVGDLAKGREFYMNNCFVCHGKKGDGKGPRSHFITPRPRNFTSDASRAFYNRPQLFTAVSKGKRGTVMPAWEKVLNEQQIADVAEFVFQTFIQTSAGVEGTKQTGDDKTSHRADPKKKKAREPALALSLRQTH